MFADLSKFDLQQVAARKISVGTTDEISFERIGEPRKLKFLTNIFLRNNTHPFGEVWVTVGDKPGIRESNDSNRLVCASGILTPRSTGQTVGYFTMHTVVPFYSWIQANFRNVTLNDTLAAVMKYFEEI